MLIWAMVLMVLFKKQAKEKPQTAEGERNFLKEPKVKF